MMFAYDVPGYVQGHRFSDHPDWYDGGAKYFRDLAGADRFGQGVSHVVGTPTFASRGARSQRGLLLDNTCHWQFPHSCPWHGSGLVVVEMAYVLSGTNTFFPWIFGEAAGVSTNALISAGHFSGQRLFSVTAGGGQLSQMYSDFANNQIAVFAWSRNQQDRRSRITRDGIMVTQSDAYQTGNNHGLSIGLGGQYRCRLGNLSGTAGDTVATAFTMHVFEQHFWRGDVLRDNLPDLAAFIETLKGVYGIA